MRKNSKQLRFFCGTVLLCVLGVEGYWKISQAGSPSLNSTPTAVRSPSMPDVTRRAVLTTATTSVTQQANQTLNGFSIDSRHFIYLESWRDTGAGIPQATLQIINLTENTCVKQGCLQTNYGETDANLSLQTAEDHLLQQTQALRQTLNLTQPIAGTRLPILSKSRTPDGFETMTIQLNNGQPLQIRLKQTKETAQLTEKTDEKDRTAIELTAIYQGKKYLISDPHQWHDWTVNFSLREVQQSPDGKQLAVLLTAEKRAFEGTLGKTAIQSLALPSE